jgi:hypothetical protein
MDSERGISLMQAKVASIQGRVAQLEQIREYQPGGDGLVEVLPAISGPIEMDVTPFERPLTDRLAEALQFLDQHAVADR